MAKNLITTPFDERRKQFTVPAEITVSDLLLGANVPITIHDNVIVTINDSEVEQEHWPTTKLAEDDRVALYVIPLGGGDDKSIMRLIATVVVSAVALWVSGGAGGAITSKFMAYAAGAAVGVVGTLAINALIPPPEPSINTPSEAGLAYFFSGQKNSAKPYEIVPIVYGFFKMVPNLAVQPIVTACGSSSELRSLYDFGLGYVDIFNVRAGDTLISDMVDATIYPMHVYKAVPNYLSNRWQPIPLQYVNYPINYADVGIPLEVANSDGTVTTATDALQGRVEIAFPSGLIQFAQDGKEWNRSVEFKLEFREHGGTQWQNALGSITACGGDKLLIGGDIAIPPVVPGPPTPPRFFPQFEANCAARDGHWILAKRADQPIILPFTLQIRMTDVSNSTPFFPDPTDSTWLQFVNENGTDITSRISSKPPTWQMDNNATQHTIVITVTVDMPDKNPNWSRIKLNLGAWNNGGGISFPTEDFYSPSIYSNPSYDPAVPVPPPPTFPPPGGGGGTADPDYNRTPGQETYVRDYVRLKWYNGLSYWHIESSTLCIDGVCSPKLWWEVINHKKNNFVVQEENTAEGGNTRIFYYAVDRTVLQSYNIATFTGADGKTHHISEPYLDGITELYITGKTLTPQVAALTIQFPYAGQWDVRLTRVTPDEDNDPSVPDTSRVSDKAVFNRLISFGERYDITGNANSILTLKTRHTLLELMFPASDEITGDVQEINAEAQSWLRYKDTPTGSYKVKASNNPAWVALDILTGYSIQNRGTAPKFRNSGYYGEEIGWVTTQKIDMQSFIDLAAECEETIYYDDVEGIDHSRKRYAFNSIIASDAPIIDTVQSILAMCRARLTLDQSGKLTIFRDRPQSIPKQLFTPANSWGFKGERVYQEMPDAFRVKFIAPELDWQQSEVVVYRPGKTEQTANTFEDLETVGCTNWHQAAWFGKWMLAQAVIRSETFTINVEAEHLVCQVGDLVHIQHDVPMLGGEPLYVKSVTGNRVTLNRHIGQFANPGYTWRRGDGNVITGACSLQSDDYFEVSSMPSPSFRKGDLIVLGTIKSTGYVTDEYLVSSISPKSDFTATVKMVRYDERLYKTDNNEDFPIWDPNFGMESKPETVLKVTLLQGKSEITYVDRQPYSTATLTWNSLPSHVTVGTYQISWRPYYGGENRIVAEIPGGVTTYKHSYPAVDAEFGNGYYTVTPYSAIGYKGQSQTVYVPLSVDRTPPVTPTNFISVYQPNNTTKLTWDGTGEPDHDGYLVYQSATNSGVSAATFIARLPYDTYEYIVPGDKESHFYIVAIDTSGNQSAPAHAFTTYPTPETPKNLKLFFSSDANAILTWDLNASSWVNEYKIFYSPDETETDVNAATVHQIGSVDGRTNTFSTSPNVGSYFVKAGNKWGLVSGAARVSTLLDTFAVVNLALQQEIHFDQRYPFDHVRLTWSATGPVDKIKRYKVEFTDATGVVHQLGETPVMSYEYILDILRANPDLKSGTFKVTPESIYGLHGLAATVPYTASVDTDAPSPPTNFFANVVGTHIELNWNPSLSIDIDRYVLRYSPKVDNVDWDSAEKLADVDHETLNLTVNARTGSYLVAAYDTSGNRSIIGIQRTTIEKLPDINTVATVNDATGWVGNKLNMVKVGGTTDPKLELRGTPQTLPDGRQVLQGTYTYDQTLNLGDVYESRLSSKIQAQAVVAPGLEAGDWDVWVEYRVSDSGGVVIADWPTLDDPIADPIASVVGVEWSAWRRFYAVDTTAQLFQFRIVAQTFNPANAVIFVTDGLVEVDMPDRLFSKEDIAVSAASGVTVLWDPPFRKLSAVAVTIDGNSRPVVAEIILKNETQLDLRLVDNSGSTPVAVAGQVDVLATGYGKLRPKTITDGSYAQEITDTHSMSVLQNL